jgi:uncharacterized protein (DUF1778 family)
MMTKSPDTRRTESVEVSLTAAEKDEIIRAARSEGMQTSAFIRFAALALARGAVS